MKKSSAFFLILSFSAFVGGLSSCKKEAANTSFSRIAGKWKETQTATDDNGDGVIEAYEIHNVEAGFTDVLNFKADSTGTEIQTSGAINDSTPALNFYWKLIDNDSLYLAYAAHDTLTYYISELNASSLVLTIKSTDNAYILTQNSYIKE